MYLDHTTTTTGEDLSLLTTYTKIEPDSPDINIYTSTIRSLSLQLSLGNLTSLQIVTAYLRQIELHNPKLKALIHVAPRDELMALARESDNERQKGNCKGALHGIPIIVK
jgi:amidase